jgi:PPM family protein phosphatase
VHHLVQSGLIRPEDAKDHPERNRIFNCIGAYVAPTVEIGRPFALRNGDTMLLCSDGLWGSLSDRQVAEAFNGKTVMRAIPELIELALELGGPESDNCTAVAMTWAGSESMEMVPPSEEPVSTLLIPEGTVASTVQMPRVGEVAAEEELSEEQIDDAVAEIQKAIQRAGKLVSK